MSSGPQRIPPNVRQLPGMGGGPSMPGLTPLSSKQGGTSRWWLWLLLLPLLLLGLTYVLGRTVEPMRARLEQIPLAGKLLFGDPVWQVLWNKPPQAAPAKAQETAAPGAVTPSDKPAGLSDLEAEVAARMAAVEQRENEVARREATVKAAEPAVAAKQKQLDQDLAATTALKEQLQGQLRTELDRVAVIRSMKSSAITQMFTAMTDDEVITVLKYMTADEVAKLLGGLDPYRSARLLHRLTAIAPTETNP
jgi:flagellar motility protein MotE (MotC chaperone)